MPDDLVAKVEIAFADGPFVASPTWTDVTQYVEHCVTKMGRQYELDRFQPGTATVEMRTVGSRLFDPEYTTGTYYGKLTPMRQIRITKTYSAVTYPIFRGFVTDWGQTIPDADNVFYTTISAMDALGAFEKIQLPSSAWALMVQRDDPTLWFRLGETDTPRVTDSSDGGNYGIFSDCQQGAQGLVPNDQDGAVAFAHSLEERVYVQTTPITGYPFTVTALVQIDGSDPDGFKVIFAGYLSVAERVVLSLTDNSGIAGGSMRAFITSAATTHSENAPMSVSDGKTHHLAWVVTNANTWAFYIDGVAQTNLVTDAGSPAYPTGALIYSIGNYPDQWPYLDYGFGTDKADGTLNKRGTIDELCVWNGTALAAADVAAQSLAAKTGWDGDDTGARVNRILLAIDWPSLLTNVNTGISILGPSTWSTGESVLSVLQALADTEYGAFFAGPDGKIVWYSRHHRYLNTKAVNSQATFGDTNSGEALKYVAEGFDLHRDEALIRNPVLATRSGGVTVTVRDQTLIDDTYGPNAWSSPATQDQQDSAVRDRALWLLARYKTEATRLKSMTIIPKTNPTGLWPKALGLGIADRITVKRQQLGIGNTTTVDQWIEGISHDFTRALWKTTFVGSPVETQSYLVLDNATTGKLDTGVLGY